MYIYICIIYIFLQNFGYIPLFKQVCIKLIPLFKWTHFSINFSTSRNINLKLYTPDKKDIIRTIKLYKFSPTGFDKMSSSGKSHNILLINLEYSS